MPDTRIHTRDLEMNKIFSSLNHSLWYQTIGFFFLCSCFLFVWPFSFCFMQAIGQLWTHNIRGNIWPSRNKSSSYIFLAMMLQNHNFLRKLQTLQENNSLSLRDLKEEFVQAWTKEVPLRERHGKRDIWKSGERKGPAVPLCGTTRELETLEKKWQLVCLGIWKLGSHTSAGRSSRKPNDLIGPHTHRQEMTPQWSIWINVYGVSHDPELQN